MKKITEILLFAILVVFGLCLVARLSPPVQGQGGLGVSPFMSDTVRTSTTPAQAASAVAGSAMSVNVTLTATNINSTSAAATNIFVGFLVLNSNLPPAINLTNGQCIFWSSNGSDLYVIGKNQAGTLKTNPLFTLF